MVAYSPVLPRVEPDRQRLVGVGQTIIDAASDLLDSVGLDSAETVARYLAALIDPSERPKVQGLLSGA